MSVATVNNKMQPLSTASTATGLPSGLVRERPIYSQELGEFFKRLRPADWTQSDAARYAKQRKIAISRNILVRLEAGQIKHVEPTVLRALATLYGHEYDAMAADYFRFRYGLGASDLGDHSRTASSSLHTVGGSTDAAADASRRLKSLVARDHALADKADHALRDLAIVIATLREEAGASARPQAGRRGRSRKTG